MIHLDTSVLVDALSGARASEADLRQTLERGEHVNFSSVVLYEWLRGPRLGAEVAAQEVLFPSARAVPFGPREAEVAALLYRTVSRPRERSFDLAVAACALTSGAAVWTLNPQDFRDIPDLALFTPPHV